jgi:hypothetical protein
LPDGVSKEGLRGISAGDSRSCANEPLSARMAGGNGIIGLAMDNRLQSAPGNSRREVTAAAAHVVQLTPRGGAKDIRLRLAPLKSRRDCGRREKPAMATHVAHRQKWSTYNPLRVAAENPDRRVTVMVTLVAPLHQNPFRVVAPDDPHRRRQQAQATVVTHVPHLHQNPHRVVSPDDPHRRRQQAQATVMVTHVPHLHQNPFLGRSPPRSP